MTTVKLYGHLGEKFGKEFKFDVVTPKEALHALKANFPEFAGHLIQNNEPGYWIFVGKENRDKEGLYLPAGRQTIKIVPVVKGAKKSPIWSILIGVALVVVAGPLGALGGGALATAVVGIGISLALNGISALIAGNPNDGPEDRGDNRQSTFFSGPVNTIQQGGPVPLIYGKVLAGSVVVSAGVRTETTGAVADDENCTQSMGGAEVCV